MGQTRKIAAILVSDVVGYSRLTGADEDRILARLRTLRSDLVDPTIAVHHGRIVKRTGDGAIVEFRSVVDAVNCAIEIQRAMVERNAEVTPDKRIEFRIGVHLGDVVEEADGDLMGDGVNIAARLEGIAEPGAICLSEDAYRQVKGRLDLAVSDLGPTQLKNIAEPIRVYAVATGSQSAAPAPSASEPNRRGPPRLSIVVLPFANIGGDPEQEHFVDGVTESLSTDLSRLLGPLVISHNTAFTYKGKAFDVKQIGRELNVRYVLAGSIQSGGNRMRVSVQLIDAESGSHLWAERFDKPLADLFDMQDGIVARLVKTLDTELIAAAARRARRAPNPNSMDLYFQGLAWHSKGITPDSLATARHFFDQALALDPANFRALVQAAAVDVALAVTFLPDDRAARLASAEAAVTKALSIAPENASAHLCLGMIQMSTNRAALAIRECELALELDRNLANAHHRIGEARFLLGQAKDTESHVQEALRLSPRDPFVFLWRCTVGSAKYWLGEEEEAVAWLRRSIEANGNYPSSHFILAATLASLGRLFEAQSEVRTGLAINPTFTIVRFSKGAMSDNPAYLAGRERLIEALHKAGVPEE